MSILRTDKIAGLESVNAITGSVKFTSDAGAGHGTYLEVNDPDGTIKFGTGEFSIEFWMYANNTDTSAQENDLACILDYGYASSGNTAGAHFALHQDDAKLSFGFNNATQLETSNFLTANTWHHVAVQRQGGNTKIYGDGTQVGTVADTQDYTDALFRTLQIGSQAASGSERNFDGYISTLRICKGHAVYNGAFTPPTRALEVHPGPDDDRTVVFCCYSSQDATQEATGKTLAPMPNSAGPLASTFVPDVGNDHTHGTVLEGGIAFSSLNYMTLPRGTTTQSNRGRGLLGGSNDGSPFSDNIQYINIQSQGNSVDFGNLTLARSRASSYASSTRGIWGGGTPGANNTIDYVTIATTANAINFGDLTVARRFCSGTSSATRGLTAGGNEAPPSSPYPSVNVIDYTTIASAGDATDFGDLLGKRSGPGALSSPTRALFGGGYSHGSPAAATNDITYVEIATTGNSVDFGDLTNTRRYLAGVSNNTRGVFGSGSVPGANNVIDYVTIATTGNATDFGDATISNEHRAGISNSIRGVWAGSGSPAIGNHIDYVTIATTGNATDFGDTATNMGYTAGCSDSHGGLTE